jgi:hypothetical protein
MLAFHTHLVMVADHFKPKGVLEALEQYMHTQTSTLCYLFMTNKMCLLRM